ncbi:dTDP-4-dehydrorhamnose 3,5-epimerase [Thiomicrospira microaerophila]|uniref:dTDP-4-dehydrorhamnose 3,5-epimerase n=1 Tax=Thiomicrospira microaerophila TaxID=406020 RepID=UPI00200C2963|nr:dTDP-4-dehydrorhamnose 3,5-epimerase [Thiomicrospira microaerophila]UQB43369.1 dTDP-4-dehydrorhamnose 3,5-epimerase [Thiomicrospira microaerophila]
MKIIQQAIGGVYLIQPQVHTDGRGYFVETFRQDLLQQAIGYPIHFCQDNEAHSEQGVLRGLHFQWPPYAQSKLIRVIEGEILDIAVDLRPNSPNFGQHHRQQLSAQNQQQLYIPKGFAHGYLVLSSQAKIHYKVDAPYAPNHEGGLAYNDPQLNINWRTEPQTQKQATLSEKDQNQPRLADIRQQCQAFNAL